MKTSVVIIGAGPYGVAAAIELDRLNIPFVITGDPFTLWFNHTLNTMAIRSDWHTSEIFSKENKYSIKKFIFDNYPERAKSILEERMPVDVFRAYLRDVLDNLPFEINRSLAKSLTRTKDGFAVVLGDGTEIETKAVVVATGIGSHKFLPQPIASLGNGNVVHTWHVDEYSHWENKNVLVIGSGQSGGEAVAHLNKANTVTWVLRHEPIFYSEPINLPTPVFKFFLHTSPWLYFLPEGLRKSISKSFVRSTLTPDFKPYYEDGMVTVALHDAHNLGLSRSGTKVQSTTLEQSFDAVVAATGYKYSLETLGFMPDDILSEIKMRGGSPKIQYDFATSIPNLYMIGGISEPTYGPAQRFIMGSRHAALKIGSVMKKL